MVGSCGQSALVVSAPVGATVISRRSAGTSVTGRSCQSGLDSSTTDRTVERRKDLPMRAVIQRVLRASRGRRREDRRRDRRSPDCWSTSASPTTTAPAEVAWMARKIWELRLLRDEQSASDVGAPILVVSQFTLYGDARKGRRPTWQAAAPGTGQRTGVRRGLRRARAARRPRRARRLRRGHAGRVGQRRAGHADTGESGVGRSAAATPATTPTQQSRHRTSVHTQFWVRPH